MKILKIAINSQTVRIITDNVCLDYHVDDGNSSSILLKYLKGHHISLDQYKSKEVKSTDIFSWKSDSDGENKINYLDIQNRNVVYRDMKSHHLPRQYYSNIQQTSHRNNPEQNRIELNNKKNFKNLFGGNS